MRPVKLPDVLDPRRAFAGAQQAATSAELLARATAATVLPDFVWGGGSELPGEAVVLQATIDPDLLGRYREVCGYGSGQSVPLTLPAVLGFEPSLRMMTGRHFPLAPLGMVHIADRVSARRELEPDEQLKVRVAARDLRPHHRGALVDVVTEVRGDRDVEPAWCEVATYLSRGAKAPESAQPLASDAFEVPEIPDSAAHEELQLSGNLGRRFGAVSGDRNPIHMNPLFARAFGFRTTIIHGRWETARSVAVVAGALRYPVSVVSVYRKPLFIPGRPVLSWVHEGPRAQVWLTGAGGDPVHAYTEVTSAG